MTGCFRLVLRACPFVLGLVLLSTLAGIPSQAQTPEFRAFWVDAFHNGFKTPAQVDQLLADVRSANCNAVVVEMRKRGDTYYPSPYEPFAPDADPSFDALAYLIDKAHNGSPRIEVHAWLCTLPIAQDPPPTDPNHPYNKYPEYLTKNSGGATFDGSNYCFDPGNPGAFDYTVNVYLDVVRRYDVDGIHYDYVRFAGNSWGYNDVSVERFNARYGRTGLPASGDPLWLQWRRDQVTALVRKIYANAIAIKPNIKISAATVTWGGGPGTEDGWYSTSAYASVLQDWRAWMEEGILDINMPMCYDREYDATQRAYYDSWIYYVKGHKYNRQAVIGPGIYMNGIADSITQYRDVRLPGMYGGMADGICGYSYAVSNSSGQPFSEFARALAQPSGYDPNPIPIFDTPVPTPVMPWKASPTKGHIKGTMSDCGSAVLDGAAVSITGPETRTMTTDGTGFYAFIDVEPGTYTLTAFYPGRPTKDTTVQVAAGQVATADLDLCADPTPPVISNVRAENVGLYTADVRWTTDDPSTSQVEYGLTTSYGSTATVSDAPAQNHIVSLNELVCGRTYHYRVRSRNMSGYESVSGDYTFATSPDTTPPVISSVNIASISSTEAFVTWITDDPSTSQIEYGLTSSYGQSTTVDSQYVTGHGLLVSGLDSSTTYHFRVRSVNGSGLGSYSGDGTFTTTTPPELVVDNLEGASSGSWTAVNAAGGWPTSDSQYVYAKNNKNSTTATFIWTPDITQAGKYDVYCWYAPDPGNTTNAKYTIYYSGGGSLVATVDQTTGGSQWVKIGTDLQFDPGAGGYVRLINRTSEPAGSTNVVADAVRFVYKDTDQEPPSVPQNLDVEPVSTSQMSLTWDAAADNTGVVGYKIFRDSVQVGISFTTAFIDTGLSVNTRYSYSISAYDARSNESGRSGPVSQFTLSTPPTIDNVLCNRNSGTWYNTSPFIFTNILFGAGQMGYYKYAWDTSAAHTWDDTEWTWAAGTITLDGNSGPDGFYFHVRSFNSDGIPNGTLDLGPYYSDTDPPVVESVTAPKYLAVRGSAYDDLNAVWFGTDGQSGIAEYQYAIGTSPGWADILNWTSSGTAASADWHYADVLLHDYHYYFSVKARDLAGNWSNPVSSDGSVYANAYSQLAAAMNNPDGTPVIIDQGKVLTANLGTCCYIQEPDRARGLRLDLASSMLPGARIVFGGRLLTSDGERRLSEVEASPAEGSPSGGSILQPLAMEISTVGGASPDQYTPGISGAKGCYNLGLLVRLAGRVVSKGSGFFVIDDGSGAAAKVYSEVLPSDNSFVGVTGVSGVGGGMRVIRTRSADDVHTYR